MSELDQINSALPSTLRQAPAMPAAETPTPEAGGGGLIDFFKSLFHRQSDLDAIINQNGLRGPAQPYAPSTGGVRG